MKIVLWITLFIFVGITIGIYLTYRIRPATYNGTYATHGEIKLWTETFGNQTDPALLLISGAMAPARLWSDAFCSYIATKGFFVIRFDLRDMGLSSGIDYEKKPYDLNDLTSDSVAVLDHLNIKKAYIAGISMGGSIAELFALKYPKRCLGMILISSPAPGVKLNAKEEEELKKTWAIFRKNNPTLNFKESYPSFLESYTYLNGSLPVDEQMVKDYVRDMYERTNHLYITQGGKIKQFEDPHSHVRAQMHGNIQLDQLKEIAAPTLIIQGERDPIVFPVNAHAAQRNIKGAQLHILKGMGHMIFNRELERKIADLIIQFMSVH